MADYSYDDISNIEKDMEDIDLRKEVEMLIEEYGVEMLYIRNNRKLKCRCYNNRTKDGDTNCKICGGSGFVSILERVKGIYQNYDETGFVRETEVGDVTSNTVIFYFNEKTVPVVGDRILLVAYDRTTSIPVPININKSMSIISVDPIRGDRGRIESYKCFAKYAPEKITLDQKRLNCIPLKDKKKIMKGVKYTWPQN